MIREILENNITHSVLRKDCTCSEWKWGWSDICPTCTAKKIEYQLSSLVLDESKVKKLIRDILPEAIYMAMYHDGLPP